MHILKNKKIIAGGVITASLIVGGGMVMSAGAGTVTTSKDATYSPVQVTDIRKNLEDQRGVSFEDPTIPLSYLLKTGGYLHEMNGGLWLNTTTGLPPCDLTIRGTIWFSSSKDGTDDQLLLCMRDATSQMIWKSVTLNP